MYRIAICDDDVRMRRFLCRTVSESGISCRVEEFAGGADLLRGYGEYDILFLDIDMPGGNGIEVAERIRRSDRKVKIIYVTGYQDYMSQSFAVHPFAFLVKPVQKEEIIRQMKEALIYGGEEEKGIPFRVQTTEGIEEFGISEPEASVCLKAQGGYGAGKDSGILGDIRTLWFCRPAQELRRQPASCKGDPGIRDHYDERRSDPAVAEAVCGIPGGAWEISGGQSGGDALSIKHGGEMA